MAGRERSPSEVLADQLPGIRQRLNDMSGADLSARVEALGGKLGRMAISKIENKQRGVSLDETLLLAAALDVAPIHLFLPREDEGEVMIGTSKVPAVLARAWVRGSEPLPGGDEKTFATEVPTSEWQRQRRASERELEAMDKWHRARRQLRVAEELLDMRRAEYDQYEHLEGSGLRTAAYQRAERRYDEAEVAVAEARIAAEEARADYLAVARTALAEEEGEPDGVHS